MIDLQYEQGEYVLFVGELLGRSEQSAFGCTGDAAFQVLQDKQNRFHFPKSLMCVVPPLYRLH